MEMTKSRKPHPTDESEDLQASDRSQASVPPASPLPVPRGMTEDEIRERAEAARHRDPTAATGQAG
jgi:hypothetical protein